MSQTHFCIHGRDITVEQYMKQLIPFIKKCLPLPLCSYDWVVEHYSDTKVYHRIAYNNYISQYTKVPMEYNKHKALVVCFYHDLEVVVPVYVDVNVFLGGSTPLK